MRKNNQGFTLLELSIVIVIIGLLAGGVMVGADLIKAAELRAVITEHQKYRTAVMAFKDRYMAIPGDMKNATSFWGAAHATPATCKTTASTGEETCDGDGDGILESNTGSDEWFRFWQHLANAGMIEGQYSGVRGAGGTYHSVIGTNVPESKFSNSGWATFYRAGTFAGDTVFYSGVYGNHFLFGGSNSTSFPVTNILVPEEAWNIDKKIDDGKPGMGAVVVRSWDDCTDASGETDTDSDYDLSLTTQACTLVFLRQF